MQTESVKQELVKVTGVAVIAVYVTDLERAHAFYTNVLGLYEKAPMPPGVMLGAGDTTIYLEGGREGRAAAGLDAPTVSLCFDTPSVRATWEALQAEGVVVVDPYGELSPEFAMFRIEDPDGNVIEFVGKP